jgi:hypothetical protein
MLLRVLRGGGLLGVAAEAKGHAGEMQELGLAGGALAAMRPDFGLVFSL